MADFSAREMLAVQVSERTMSVLSILGSLFIIITFLCFPYFRKPINRLVFFASGGNLLTNIATLIATSALPRQGAPFPALCEFQGVMIQWFMMADTLWVLSMALNVMLVFFRGYDHKQLRRLEKWYMLFSYGAPGCIAISYIIAGHAGSHRKQIIGPATIWCWVGKDAEWMRLAFFYMPIWASISITLCIYIATGHQIFKKRAELRSLSRRTDVEMGNIITNPFTATGIRVETEMKIETSTSADHDSLETQPPSRGSFLSSRETSLNRMDNLTPLPFRPPTVPKRSLPQRESGPRTGYKATAFSTNRIATKAKQSNSFSGSQYNLSRRRTAAMEGNAAAWGYLKVAFLMFTALFIVWVPSTVNRMQQFIDRDDSIFGLNLASALVLPLQGFWNAMIYVSTTWSECKRALADTLDELSSRRSAIRSHPYTKRICCVSTAGIQDLGDSPISLSKVKHRPESQQHLPPTSSLETLSKAVTLSAER